jgi:hypothetical protein
MLENLQILGCNISLKLHFLHFHLDYFPENLGDLSEEQGARFHQDVKEMERRYQGRWDVSMVTDYCWSIKREAVYQDINANQVNNHLQQIKSVNILTLIILFKRV